MTLGSVFPVMFSTMPVKALAWSRMTGEPYPVLDSAPAIAGCDLDIGFCRFLCKGTWGVVDVR